MHASLLALALAACTVQPPPADKAGADSATTDTDTIDTDDTDPVDTDDTAPVDDTGSPVRRAPPLRPSRTSRAAAVAWWSRGRTRRGSRR